MTQLLERPPLSDVIDEPRTWWPDRRICAGLFLGTMLFYIAVLRGDFEVYDTQSMLAVTQNLVNHGSLRETGTHFALLTTWSWYGLGVSLVAVPAYALSKLIGHFDIMASLINPFFTACSVVLIFRIARELKWRSLYGVISALSFGIFSMAVWYTTELLSEPGVILGIFVMIFAIIRWRNGWSYAPLVASVAVAWAIQFRNDSVLNVGAGLLAIPLFVPWSTIFSKRTFELFI
ncbi:MAG: hypothetical protein WAM97_12165, partial [Acidimicrobiales bacterium]